MDEEISYITVSLRKLEKYVRTLPSMRRMRTLGREDREKLTDLEGSLSEARRLANDEAASDDGQVKKASLGHCQEQLETFRAALLTASHTNLVDAVDVAQLSAMADQIGDLVKKRIA